MAQIINQSQKSTATVYNENRYAEFSTFFRIPFKEGEVNYSHHTWKDLLGSWREVLILALELRMDSCVSMLFRNRNNVIMANEYHVVFKKSNGQIHSFNHPSFQAMEIMLDILKSGNLNELRNQELGVRQLLKALYWIPEDQRQDHGGFGFGQLISCLEEFTFHRHETV